METKTWEANFYEIEIDSIFYCVFANFNWQKDSVGFEFSPTRQAGRDTLASVPYEVKEIEAYGKEDEKIEDKETLQKLGELVLKEFLKVEGVKDLGKGGWM